MSASIGIGRFLRSAWFSRHARWTYSESTLAPSSCASRSAKSLFKLPNAAISVEQTNVKSFGQKKTTFHLPENESSLISLNAFLLSEADRGGQIEFREFLSYAKHSDMGSFVSEYKTLLLFTACRTQTVKLDPIFVEAESLGGFAIGFRPLPRRRCRRSPCSA